MYNHVFFFRLRFCLVVSEDCPILRFEEGTFPSSDETRLIRNIHSVFDLKNSRSSMSEETLRDWVFRISGISELDESTLSAIVGTDISFQKLDLSEREWVIFLLYFVITRRAYSKGTASCDFSKRDKMLLIAFQNLFSTFLTTLEFETEVYELFDLI